MLQLSHLKLIPDNRRGQGRMYDLPHVLLCCILAVAAGADSYRAIARFIELRFDWLKCHTGLKWHRAPRHTSLRAILLTVDHAAIETVLREHTRSISTQQESTIAIKGKALHGGLGRFADTSALQWLSALAEEDQLVLGQVALADGDKDAEITAARHLISSLGLHGKLFTLEALHCQKNTGSVTDSDVVKSEVA